MDIVHLKGIWDTNSPVTVGLTMSDFNTYGEGTYITMTTLRNRYGNTLFCLPTVNLIAKWDISML